MRGSIAALRGERPDRVPVLLHTFMMAAREAGHTMKAFREDPTKLAGSFIRAVENYGYDGVMADVDTAPSPARWASPSSFPRTSPPSAAARGSPGSGRCPHGRGGPRTRRAAARPLRRGRPPVIRLMTATGAHMVSNGDSPAGPDLVSPSSRTRPASSSTPAARF